MINDLHNYLSSLIKAVSHAAIGATQIGAVAGLAMRSLEGSYHTIAISTMWLMRHPWLLAAKFCGISSIIF